VNASKIARETVKLSITNTAMIGAFLRVAEDGLRGGAIEGAIWRVRWG